MAKSTGLFALVLAILIPVIAGCGGGSGIGTVEGPPIGGDSRTLSGAIVRTDTGEGLPNVLVRLGDTDKTAVSGTAGVFSFTVATGTDIPVFVQVDTSGAGAAFPPGNVVRYNGQNCLPTYIDVPVAVLNGDTNALGSIGVFNAAGDVPVPPPFASKNTVIVGQILSKKTGSPIPNATVRFGPDRLLVAASGARGFFGISLGRNVPVLSLYPGASGTFQVDTTTAGAAFPATLPISFRAANYDQSAVEVPVDVMTGEATYLGVLTVVDDGSGDGPPPPPGDDGTPPPPPF